MFQIVYLFNFTIKVEVKVIKLSYLFTETKFVNDFMNEMFIKANKKY